MASVVWTPGARIELLQAAGGLTAVSPTYSIRFLEQVREATQRLEDFPEIGPVIRRRRGEDIRLIVVQSYLLLYRIREGEIHILGVVHGARDLSRYLRQNPLTN